MTSGKLFRVWKSMHARCSNPGHTSYRYYGGRGIGVCERWSSFEMFAADVGDCPPGMTLERRDNEKGYCPDNCRWATPTEQSRNRRNIKSYTHNGVSQCLSAWAEQTGIKWSTLRKRVADVGFSRAIQMPLPSRKAMPPELVKPSQAWAAGREARLDLLISAVVGIRIKRGEIDYVQ